MNYSVLPVSAIADPEFTEEIGNITVPAGRDVKLACSVKDLGTYKVSAKANNIIHLAKFLPSCEAQVRGVYILG